MGGAGGGEVGGHESKGDASVLGRCQLAKPFPAAGPWTESSVWAVAPPPPPPHPPTHDAANK